MPTHKRNATAQYITKQVKNGMKPHILLFLSLLLVLLLAIISLFTLTPLGKESMALSEHHRHNGSELTVSSVSTFIPPPTLQPILTVQGPAPTIAAGAAYLLNANTGHTLSDVNGEKLLPMASTTKIMTALIAIQTADLDQIVQINQDAYNRAHNNGGSSANLVVGDQISLKDLLYGLLLPSGDDAAVAIADALGGTQTFVQKMNFFAYRLHLFFKPTIVLLTV